MCDERENERRPIWDVVFHLRYSEVIRRNQNSFDPCSRLCYIWQGPSFNLKGSILKIDQQGRPESPRMSSLICILFTVFLSFVSETGSCHVEAGFDYSGPDVIKSINVTSYEECAKYCYDTRNCSFWSYKNNEECYLSSDMNRTADNGTISGTKACGMGKFITLLLPGPLNVTWFLRLCIFNFSNSGSKVMVLEVGILEYFPFPDL